MRRSLNQLRDADRPVGLVELAQHLLGVDRPIDSGLARRVVALALDRTPGSLPEHIDVGDLRPEAERELADQPIELADFVVVDLETTGLSAASASILEIGAVRVSRLRVTERFETLVRPPGKVPRAIAALTGIHDAMAAEAPTRKRALRSFRDWLDRTPLAPFVAHNASFDHGFVTRALDQCALPPYPGSVLCTCKLARRLVPDLGRYNLDHLCAHFGVSNRARHRALGDADATATALIDLLQLGMTRFELRTVGDLIEFHRRPPAKRKRRRRS